MARKPLIRCSEFPYHITNRSNNREFFYLDLNELWAIYLNCFCELEKQYGCHLHAFVLMSNHYHLLISTPEKNIGDAMMYLHREVARAANRNARRINHFFGGRYHWSVIADENYYWNAVKYIFRNPVRARICSLVHQYEFSSLHRELHRWKMVDFFRDKDRSIELNMDWLNEPFQCEEEQGIKKGLRRKTFELPRAMSGRKLILEVARYKKGPAT